VAQAGGAGLRIYLDTPLAIEPVATVLREAARATQRGAKGPISFCLLDDSLPGEVDMELGQEFPVTPQIKGALKSLEGVLMVEDL
jgi:DNA polymerase-3 subunit alpha